MQIERESKSLPKEFFDQISDFKDYTQRIDERISFDDPEEFTPEKMETALKEKNVVEVHVFKNTTSNMKFAELRKKHPNKTRKQLRNLMKKDKNEH